MVDRKKIIFAGLDNGGKTSIIYSLQQKFSFMNAKPTFGMQRSTISETKCLGLEFVTWDMGGQSKFREDYFKQRYRVFSSVSTMFYVIDIQDKERYSEALEYYQNIIKTFEELKEIPKIVVCFHKYDPDIQSSPEMLERQVGLLQKATEIGKSHEILHFNTTIHDLSSIIKAFSEGVIKGSPKEKLISDHLRDYAKATFSSAVILMDESTLIVGSHYTQKLYLDICEAVAPRFLSAMERICQYKLLPQDVMVNLKFSDKDEEACEDGGLEAMVFVKSFKTPEGLVFNIVALSRNKNTFKLTDKFLPELTAHLSELMHMMVS